MTFGVIGGLVGFVSSFVGTILVLAPRNNVANQRIARASENPRLNGGAAKKTLITIDRSPVLVGANYTDEGKNSPLPIEVRVESQNGTETEFPPEPFGPSVLPKLTNIKVPSQRDGNSFSPPVIGRVEPKVVLPPTQVEPNNEPKPAQPKSTAKVVQKPIEKPKLVGREKIVPGYVVATIEGFTVAFSKEAWSHKDDAEYIRTPAKVIEGELKTVVSLFRPQVVYVLRRLPIFVEWDEIRTMGNGRPGSPTAIYDPANQLTLLNEGEPPQKSRTVSILRLKMLTQEHQPNVDSGRCIMLHEIAHAVHDQLLGWSNGEVRGAYLQAMERQLYKQEDYAATNDREFFAELSCAYFDQLEYFPRTRAELKAHDPLTFRLMEQVWGTAKAAVKPKTKANPAKTTGLISPNVLWIASYSLDRNRFVQAREVVRANLCQQ